MSSNQDAPGPSGYAPPRQRRRQNSSESARHRDDLSDDVHEDDGSMNGSEMETSVTRATSFGTLTDPNVGPNDLVVADPSIRDSSENGDELEIDDISPRPERPAASDAGPTDEASQSSSPPVSVRERRRKKEDWKTQGIPKPTGEKILFQGPEGFEDKVLCINKSVNIRDLIQWEEGCIWQARKLGCTRPIYFCGLCGFGSFVKKLVVKHFQNDDDADHRGKRKAFWGRQNERTAMDNAIKRFEERKEWMLGKPKPKQRTQRASEATSATSAKRPVLVPLVPEGWLSLKTRNYVRRTTILDVPLDETEDFIFQKC